MKSVPVNGDTSTRKLEKGNTLHQIFSDSKYIFSVSSTLEKLYRYKFDPLTNEVVETLVFKRVRNGDPEMLFLRSKSPRMIQGSSIPFCSTLYDVCKIVSDGHLHGYKLRPRTTFGYGQAAAPDDIYFAFEKYEKKER